jgi:hypothetical protein
MSNIPPVAAPDAAPTAPPADPKASMLPSGVKLGSHTPDAFYDKHMEANPGLAQKVGYTPKPAAVDPAAAAPVAPAPAAPAAAVPAEPADAPPPKGSMFERLSAKVKTPVAAAEPIASPQPGANPEDGITLDQSYSPKAHDSFKQIKTIASGLRDQLTAARETERQLQAKLDAASQTAPPPDTAELTRLQAENKSMSDRLAVLDLQSHPKFQQEFIAPRDQALAAAGELLTANGITGVSVASLLALPRADFGKAVSDAAKNLSPFDQTDFAQNMRTAYQLKQNSEAALGKSRDISGALRAQNEASNKQAYDRTWQRVAGQVSEHIVEIECPADMKPEIKAAVEDYNQSFRNLRTVAEQRALAPSSVETVAENAIKSAAYDFHIQKAMPRLLGEMQALLNNNRALAEQLNAIKARNPNLQVAGISAARSGGAGPDGTLSMADLSKMGHAAAADALIGGRVR